MKKQRSTSVHATKNAKEDRNGSGAMKKISESNHIPVNQNLKAISRTNLHSKEQNDIDSIFSSISSSKKIKTTGVTASLNNSINRNNRLNVNKTHFQSSSKSSKRSKENEALPESKKIKSESDGIYRAPEKTLKMSDDKFFESSLSSSNKKPSKNNARNLGSDNLSRTEGVDRIVSEGELQKMLSNNPRAGTTPNCPFDCDCCF
ncbi:unnamed protein product [Phytomonas sp. Hart1]|nr:unnamed protein product [Phytomonas sp. Hart1]|eukprot:CCW69438.1 unnamed protein product [Phytomonas sp. isolate Hart1]